VIPRVRATVLFGKISTFLSSALAFVPPPATVGMYTLADEVMSVVLVIDSVEITVPKALDAVKRVVVPKVIGRL
jgi:hypothetical protein